MRTATPSSGFSGARLRKLRLARGIRREQLAAWTGVSIATLSAWERDETVPHKRNAWRVANVLGIDVDELRPDADDEVAAS